MGSRDVSDGEKHMTDVGLQALERIHQELLIDEEWTTRAAREFTWIGHRLAQAVRAGRVFEDRGITLSRLVAETVVVEAVEAEEAEILPWLSMVNRHAVGSAYSYDAARRVIVATTAAVMHADILDWRTKQFAAYTIAQLELAENEAEYLANRSGGTVAQRSHPVAGARTVADDMLGVLEDVFAVDGRTESRFANAFEIETIADAAKGSPIVATAGASGARVSLEVPFGEETSLLRINGAGRHRRLGNGLMAELLLPELMSQADGARIAGFLNRQEALPQTDTLHYGAWSWFEWPSGRVTATYRLFVPNQLYRPGMAQDISYAMVGRARWADRLLNGRASTVDPWQVLAERLEDWYGEAPGDDAEAAEDR